MPDRRSGPSLALYRALLILYPRAHREAYGPLMVQLFGDRLRELATTSSNLAIAKLWAATILDTAKSALEERVRKGFGMSKSAFVRFSGFLALLGAALWSVAIITSGRPQGVPGHYRLTDDVTAFMFLGLTLMTLGLVGAHTKRLRDVGWLGLIAPALAVIGVPTLAGSYVLEAPWTITMIGFYAVFLGHALGGIALGSSRILQWPLAGGLALATFLLFGFSTEDNSIFRALPFGIAWACIGFSLVTTRDRPTPAAAH